MKAIVINKFGNALEVFEKTELPVPIVGENEILVKVVATSVNPVEYKIRNGALAGLAGDFPVVLHSDVSGIVEAVGENVETFMIGDQVYGCAGGLVGNIGALAEFMNGDFRLFSKKPGNLSFTEAGALPLVAITAFEAIFDRAKVKTGQKILIYGGVGGVGHLAVQFAKLAGAEVFATVSTKQQAEIVKIMGADHVINYKTEPVEAFVNKHTNGKGFDVVFDTIGNENLENSFKATKLNGTVVTTSSLLEADLTPVHLKGLDFQVVFMLIPMLHNVGKKRHGEILEQVAAWVQQGKVKPLIDSKFSFENVGFAHQKAESGQIMGKVVISNE
ncbi:quinone oxidoreductase [Flavobacterium cyanobacteriorum]|uniref:Quinone oxidoreductase n=1 Tax=Flavobacterium cyanobacteriorum TaxID=2022802 RepID=A0A255YVD1_9FLAO|nr:zinc-dependent alcohol dehydrogenase family protein [Flavobacterium cyanobacteriorum]OYQ33206.1 quinone oxidoreductase [Flavobacterium cyanobacteriorum]